MTKENFRYARHMQGKGRGGAGSWVAVQLNSLALICLFSWLLVSIVLLPNMSYGVVRLWLARPSNSVMMVILILLSFWHAKDGLLELVDDYIHAAGSKIASLIVIYALTILGSAFCVLMVVQIGLGGR
ncbi:MAG: succinate dehydrogenase, hydrophobic membrane anchor protein [Sphingomonadaceae bacterium]